MQRASAVARLLRFMKATSLYKSPPIEIYLELAQIALRNGHGEAAIEHAMEVCGFRAAPPPVDVCRSVHVRATAPVRPM